MITIHNYEQYALDYLENNLNAVELAAMHRFLSENPLIREELSNFSLAPLRLDNHLIYTHQKKLLKPETSKPKIWLFQPATYYKGIAAAASLLLFVSGAAYLYRETNVETKQPTEIAKIEPIKQTQKKQEIAKNDLMEIKTIASSNSVTEKNAKKTPKKQTEPSIFLVKNTEKTPAKMAEKIEKMKNEKNIAPLVTFAAANPINKQNDTEIQTTEQATPKRNNEITPSLAVYDPIQGFYFETTHSNEQQVAEIAPPINIALENTDLSYRRRILKLVAPESSLEKRETKFWEAFLPETSRNGAQATAFLDEFKPAAYSK